MECPRCGASRLRLFDVVLDSGISRVCRDCVRKENLPVVKRVSDEEMQDVNRKQSVYQRLAKVSGYVFRKRNDFAVEEDEELKRIAEQSYAAGFEEGDSSDLVSNFHWIVMRFRRRKKLTQEQFAREIGFPTVVVKNLEKGLVPKNHILLIRKIENFLGVQLFREQRTFDEEREKLKEDIEEGGDVGFDEVTTKTLTIADLQELRRKREGRILGGKEEKPEVFRENISFENGGSYLVREKKNKSPDGKGVGRGFGEVGDELPDSGNAGSGLEDNNGLDFLRERKEMKKDEAGFLKKKDEMKKQKEKGISGSDEFDFSERSGKEDKKKDLSQDEMDRIVFGK